MNILDLDSWGSPLGCLGFLFTAGIFGKFSFPEEASQQDHPAPGDGECWNGRDNDRSYRRDICKDRGAETHNKNNQHH